MSRYLVLVSVLVGLFPTAQAGIVSGVVKDEKGKPISYASVYVQNGKEGTTAGANGSYQLSLTEGNYVLVAQHVGYAKQEQKIQVAAGAMQVDFVLKLQQVTLNEVVVRANAEDPAYEIIRQAIRLRKTHLEELSNFSCEVYTREQMQLRDFPKKFLGQKVDFEDGDTSKRKMLYLSETVSRYSVKPPAKSKIEVLSTRVSGNSNAFGMSLPRIINFYQNNIEAGDLNKRGFISPIADNALHFYKYKYEGSFTEDGVEVNRIKVIPRRKYEPLFAGEIMITENSWRIHSLQLQLLKSSQMEFLDTLQVEQLYAPLNSKAWVIRNQVLYPAIKMLGFDAFGSAVTVYSKFDLEPSFAPKFFNNTVVKYQEGSNKKDIVYWDSIRPLPLLPEEILDFHKKDSLEQLRKSAAYLDSIDRIRNKFSATTFLLTGQTFSQQKRRMTYSVGPVVQALSFNTVEGLVFSPSASLVKRLDSTPGGRSLYLSATGRYGFSSRHFYGKAAATIGFGKQRGDLYLSAGKYVSQFDKAEPITPLMNSLSSLFWKSNYLKLYEAWSGELGYSRTLFDAVRVSGFFAYEDRSPLANTTNYAWTSRKDKSYTPNIPYPAAVLPMQRHQAAALTLGVRWRPGQRYIEFPDRKMSLGSKYPSFHATATKGFKGFLGSDVDYLKWDAGVSDELNLKIAGAFHYDVSVGGFLNWNRVEVPDFKHFGSNQVVFARPYMRSFQALPYYMYSGSPQFWGIGHAEHHFNGALTNKIPGFRKLNWHLVAGAHAFFTDGRRNYEEFSVGLENVFKLLRADLVWSLDQGRSQGCFFRLSVTGFNGN